MTEIQNASFTVDPTPGVFPILVNHAAFADKIVLNVWGNRRKKLAADVEAGPSRPIGGLAGRVYARSMPLTFLATGNDGDLRYGKLTKWSRIPPAQLVLRSVERPLDEEQIGSALAGLFVARYRTAVAQVEMTFDIVGTSIRLLERSVFTRARRFRSF
jgi:hypothetical protein